MPHAGSKSTPQSVFETLSFCLGWGWGTPSSLWRWWRFAEWFLAALSYWEINTLLVVWMTAHCRRHPWMKVRKSEMHKDGFSTSFNSTKWSSQCCTSTWSTWLDMLDMWRSSAPQAWSNGPGCLWEVAGANGNEGNERFWCNGNECHQIRTYNLLQFATTLGQDWQDEWFLLILLL